MTLCEHDLLEYYDETGGTYRPSDRGRVSRGNLDATELEDD
ncbi:hypothetical protein [Halobiforma nitratireducens]|nr:hypothetical protein [Halobiforma nitratireducens]